VKNKKYVQRNQGISIICLLYQRKKRETFLCNKEKQENNRNKTKRMKYLHVILGWRNYLLCVAKQILKKCGIDIDFYLVSARMNT
jgi:hypothetical protein